MWRLSLRRAQQHCCIPRLHASRLCLRLPSRARRWRALHPLVVSVVNVLRLLCSALLCGRASRQTRLFLLCRLLLLVRLLLRRRLARAAALLLILLRAAVWEDLLRLACALRRARCRVRVCRRLVLEALCC